MATTYNIVEKRYNGTDYDTLYPATKGENLVSPVPIELGGTGGTTGAAGMKNLLDALSTVTPTGTDLLPLKDVSGNIAGKATVDSILSLVSGGAKIQTGSYVGTGTYGSANPCSLTFDFVPKYIAIYPSASSGDGQQSYPSGIQSLTSSTAVLFVDSDVLISWTPSNGAVGVETASIVNNTVGWYHSSSSSSQMNLTITYRYFAVG